MNKDFANNKAVVICRNLIDKFPETEYGAAHLVVSDYNFENIFVLYALQEVYRVLLNKPYDIALLETLEALTEILRITEYECVVE